MKSAWYDLDPDVLRDLETRLNSDLPDLGFSRRETNLFIYGTFPVIHEGRILEKYEIEILVPPDREEIPTVWETGGRIPRHEDNHINPLFGDICLFVPDEIWMHYPPGSDILDFLNGPVRNYFIGISLKLRGKPWPFGERSHGISGIIESYAEMLGNSEYEVIHQYLNLLSQPLVKEHCSVHVAVKRKLGTVMLN